MIISNNAVINDRAYYTSPSRDGYYGAQYYRSQQNQSNEPSMKKVIVEKSKKLKNKFLNFFYERKGYKRVNMNEDNQESREMDMHIK